CLIAELFLQVTHLFLQIVHAEIVPIVPIEIEIEMGAPATAPFRALWNLFLPQLNPDLFLLAFTQDGQRDSGAFRITANELRELVGLGENLVVQHFENVVLLDAGRGRWTVGNNVINDQTETFRQTELFADNPRHVRSLHAKIRDWNFLFVFLVALTTLA